MKRKVLLVEELVAEVRVTRRRRYMVEPSRPSRRPSADVDVAGEELAAKPTLAKCELAEVVPLHRKAVG